METLEQLKPRIEAAVPGAKVEIVPNGSPAAQPSLLLDSAHGRAVAEFLRDDPELLLDYASNATGVDWPEKVIKEKTKVKKTVDGVEKEVGGGGYNGAENARLPGKPFISSLLMMARKHGPVIIRMRTENRTDKVTLPSLTPVWRSCEFQEREIFDLYGVVFKGHPDLRRILMWPEFTDHPMRKDYVEPDDYEYEPTPHDDVLTRARQHFPGGAPA